ncbi:putative hydrolase YghX [Nymphon striatum]|nr:putative hydrolase YghX [Nymphon striatum]
MMPIKFLKMSVLLLVISMVTTSAPIFADEIEDQITVSLDAYKEKDYKTAVEELKRELTMQNPETENKQLQIPQEAFDWYDEYAHGYIDRRTFLARLGKLGVAGLSMSMISSALLPNYALAEQVSFNDPMIKASYQEFDSPKGHGKGKGYLVVPTVIDDVAPTVLVVH